jgi:antitoxin ParD1/3/4
MATRNVVLTAHQTDFVERLVNSGRYQNASEVLREGLRLVEQREAEDEMRLIALREAASIGIADIEAGRFVTLNSDEEIDQYLADMSSEIFTTLITAGGDNLVAGASCWFTKKSERESELRKERLEHCKELTVCLTGTDAKKLYEWASVGTTVQVL